MLSVRPLRITGRLYAYLQTLESQNASASHSDLCPTGGCLSTYNTSISENTEVTQPSVNPTNYSVPKGNHLVRHTNLSMNCRCESEEPSSTSMLQEPSSCRLESEFTDLNTETDKKAFLTIFTISTNQTINRLMQKIIISCSQ